MTSRYCNFWQWACVDCIAFSHGENNVKKGCYKCCGLSPLGRPFVQCEPFRSVHIIYITSPPAPHPTPGKNLPLQSTKIQGDSKLATRPCPRYTSETLPQVHKQQCCTTFPTGYQRCRIEGNHLCGFSQGPNLNGVTVS